MSRTPRVAARHGYDARVGTQERTRWQAYVHTLPAISRRGRAAEITCGLSLALGGALTLWSAWYALTCPFGGVRGRAFCSYAVGVGGVVALGGLIAGSIGVAITWFGVVRPAAADGGEGWCAAQGFFIAVAGVTIALLIPTLHCPAGYILTRVVRICVSPSDAADRLAPLSRLWGKLGVAVVAAALGWAVARWGRRLPWPVVSVVTFAAVAAATAFLVERSVGFPW